MDDLYAYMKAVLEGKSDVPLFVVWFSENETRLATELSRESFLRLKDAPLKEFERILQERKITYSPSRVARLPTGRTNLSWIRPEWLRNRVYPHELIHLFSSITRTRDFQSVLIQMLHMIELKQTGDEFWNFSSSDESWQRMAGCGGICLVRGDQVVCAMILIVN